MVKQDQLGLLAAQGKRAFKRIEAFPLHEKNLSGCNDSEGFQEVICSYLLSL